MMGYRSLITGGFAVLVAALVACGSEGPATSSNGPVVGTAGVNLGTPTVTVVATDQLAFSPASQNAHVGDIIQWTVPGTSSHTVTFDNHSDLSDLSLLPGGTWEVKFTTAGTYAYTCTVHPGMNGTIVVS